MAEFHLLKTFNSAPKREQFNRKDAEAQRKTQKK